jgi:hypothetical protein
LFQLSQLETPEKGLTVQGNLSSIQEAASFESSRQYEISQFNEQHSYGNKHTFSDKFRSSLQRYSSGMSVRHSQQCGSFLFLKKAVFKTRSPKCVVKTHSMFDESAQRSWITRDLTKRLGLLSKVRELLITPGFSNSSSTLEFYEVVELNVLANERTEVAIRAIAIGFLIDKLDYMYREKLLELARNY